MAPSICHARQRHNRPSAGTVGHQLSSTCSSGAICSIGQNEATSGSAPAASCCVLAPAASSAVLLNAMASDSNISSPVSTQPARRLPPRVTVAWDVPSASSGNGGAGELAVAKPGGGSLAIINRFMAAR
jgi:hypothetical protein